MIAHQVTNDLMVNEQPAKAQSIQSPFTERKKINPHMILAALGSNKQDYPGRYLFKDNEIVFNFASKKVH